MFTHLIRHRIRHLIRICCLRVYNLLIYNRVSGYSSMIDLLRNLSYYHLVTIPCLRSKHFKKPSPDLSYYHLVTIPSLRSIHSKEPEDAATEPEDAATVKKGCGDGVNSSRRILGYDMNLFSTHL